MTLRAALISTLCATALAGPAFAGEQGPHRGLVIGGDCVDCTFENANLAGARFLGGDFRNSNFENAELLNARLVDLNLHGARFESASLIEAHITNSGLEGADLQDAQLDRARLHQVRLGSADLTDVTMEEAVLLRVDLTGADLNDISAPSAVFRQVTFTGARVRNANFENAHFNGAILSGSNVRNANFSNAIIENVDLSAADLRGASFENARLRRVNFSGANLRGTTGLTAEALHGSCGSDVQGLPEGLTLTPCSELSIMVAEERAAEVFAATLQEQMVVREARHAEIEQARRAFEQALANIEIRVERSDEVRLEALAAAREGWEAAAEALAEAEIELAGAPEELNWTFEINRAELGEPIRIILEQANPQRIVMLQPNQAPPPPAMPPAPPLPQRVQGEAVMIGEATGNGQSNATFIVRHTELRSNMHVSAAEIGALIDATADDFAKGENAGALDFRDVQVGVWRAENAPERVILCGQVERDGDGWARFASVGPENVEVWIGGVGAAICERDDVLLVASADLGLRLEQRIDNLAE